MKLFTRNPGANARAIVRAAEPVADVGYVYNHNDKTMCLTFRVRGYKGEAYGIDLNERDLLELNMTLNKARLEYGGA
jgi:hypothetical protein